MNVSIRQPSSTDIVAFFNQSNPCVNSIQMSHQIIHCMKDDMDTWVSDYRYPPDG